MDSQVLTTILSGLFSIVSAFGSIYLKDYLDRRRAAREQLRTQNDNVSPAPAAKPSPGPVKAGYRGKYALNRPVLILIGSFAIGILSRLLRPLSGGNVHWETLIALVLLCALVIIFLVQHIKWRTSHKLLFFLLETLMLWSGFVFGWSLIQGNFWSDLVVTSVLWWLGSSIFGSIVLFVYHIMLKR